MEVKQWKNIKFLLDIAIILAMTKSFSLVSKKFNMPPVVGALIAGIILGPVVLNVVSPSDSVLNLAEVGVVVLMFQAGLETDIDELKKSGIHRIRHCVMWSIDPTYHGSCFIRYIWK